MLCRSNFKTFDWGNELFKKRLRLTIPMAASSDKEPISRKSIRAFVKLETSITQCRKAANNLNGLHKKILSVLRNEKGSEDTGTIEAHYKYQEKTFQEIEEDAKKKMKEMSENDFLEWAHLQIKEINTRHYFYKLHFNTYGKLLIQLQLQRIPKSKQPKNLLPPVLPNLENSMQNIGERASVTVSFTIEENLELDDFLNRSDVLRPRLSGIFDITNDDTKKLPPNDKNKFVNESYPTNPDHVDVREVDKTVEKDVNESCKLNITDYEEELLEDVKKPESLFDLSVSRLVQEQEEKSQSDDVLWNDFISEDSNLRTHMINNCADIVCTLHQRLGRYPREEEMDSILEQFPIKHIFSNPERQKLYESERISQVLSFLSLDLDGMSNLTIEKLRNISEQRTKNNAIVEKITKSHNWDTDSSRQFAHEMITFMKDVPEYFNNV